MPLPPSSTIVLSHGKIIFTSVFPEPPAAPFTTLKLAWASRLHPRATVLLLIYFVLCKIRPLFSQNVHLPLADPSDCPGAHPHVSVPHESTGNNNGYGAPNNGRCSVAIDICSWDTRIMLQKRKWVALEHLLLSEGYSICALNSLWSLWERQCMMM